MRKTIIILFVCFTVLPSKFAVFSAFSQNKSDKIVGIYAVTAPGTTEQSKVKIYKTTAGTYAGKVIWMKNPYYPDGRRKVDVNNPDPALRNTPGDQIILMRGFTYDSKNDEWSGGTIYNPVNGKTYKCYMKFESETRLKVRGYIGVSLFGESMYWNKL